MNFRSEDTQEELVCVCGGGVNTVITLKFSKKINIKKITKCVSEIQTPKFLKVHVANKMFILLSKLFPHGTKGISIVADQVL